MRLVKLNTEGEEIVAMPYFTSKCNQLVNPQDTTEQVMAAKQKILNGLDEYLSMGSGWVFDRVLLVFINIGKYQPLRGTSYIPLPKGLNACRGIVNIQNNDEKCFIYSVLAKLHPKPQNPHRPTHYQPYEQELNMHDIEMPMKLSQISKFEKQNNISINVFGFEESVVFPLHITAFRFPSHVNLLLISQGDKQHYCLIKDLSKLLGKYQSSDGHHLFFCNYCLKGFTTEELLKKHSPDCELHSPQKIEMPRDEDKWLKFKNHQHQLTVPVVIYADFESLLYKVEGCESDPNKSSTTPIQKHLPSGFGYKLICVNEKYSKPTVVYRGKDAVPKFLQALKKEEKYINHLLNKVEPMKLSVEDELSFQRATICHICEKELGQDKVRDHDHLKSGFNYRGAAHNTCNINYKYPSFIPVVLHNARGYDTHLILSQMGNETFRQISCIPNNKEKYISVSLGNFRILDSNQFLNASLDSLVMNLAQEGSNKFVSLKKEFPDPNKLKLLLRKGVYPYSYIDHESRFTEKQLPDIGQFYNELTEEHLSQQDYNHAQTVWSDFQIENLGQYHDLYLKTDVLLLTDVFENFRKVCHHYYQLDPAHYYTSPGLAWSAMLKKTGVVLELLTDLDQHLFIEKGIRGGIAMIAQKYAEANNPLLEGYEPEKPTRTICYWDCCNLYGDSMQRYLPQSGFHWLSQHETESLNIQNIADDAETGYILEVDLEYPSELHDLHSDYPLAPESLTVQPDMLSPYSKDLFHSLNKKPCKSSKLIPNLRHKFQYVLHYQNLKLYMELGMKLVRVHRVLAFQQSPWLKPYIAFNTEKRKQSKNDFEKDFFKLMNNSVYGKTMENLRNHVDVELISNQERLRKVLAKPSVKSFTIFHEHLAAVDLRKKKLLLNRPIYVGMAILDLSKMTMYNFHYKYIKSKYNEKAKLLFTDTDSLCYQIDTHDVYVDMRENSHIFDTSNFPTDHFLFSDKNKKVPGKFKDECPNAPPREFVGLKPKMYSLDLGASEKKVAKGVNRSVIRRKLKHQMYKDCLFYKKAMHHTMINIRSEKHQLYTYKMNKISLSPFDDKRYFLSEKTSYAYGHFKIQELENLHTT